MGGYVYLICDPANDTYKIGVTRNLKSGRIKKLQTGNPTELHIVSTYWCLYPFRIESMLHQKFFNKRVLNEWYSLNCHEITHFNEFCEEQNNIIKSMKDNVFFMKNIK